MRLTCSALVGLVTVACAQPAPLESEEPMPLMAYSVDVPSDRREWVVANRHVEGNSVVMEMIPEGDNPAEWQEVITNLAALGVELESFVDSWLTALQQSGVSVSFNETAPDGARVIGYTSPEDNAIWKFSEGRDGVYGIAYQSRADSEEREWHRRIRGAKLVEVAVHDDLSESP